MEKRRTRDDPVISKVEQLLGYIRMQQIQYGIWYGIIINLLVIITCLTWKQFIHYSLLYLLIPSIFVYSTYIIWKTISHPIFPLLTPKMLNLKIHFFNALSKVQGYINMRRKSSLTDLHTNKHKRNYIKVIKDFMSMLKSRKQLEIHLISRNVI